MNFGNWVSVAVLSARRLMAFSAPPAGFWPGMPFTRLIVSFLLASHLLQPVTGYYAGTEFLHLFPACRPFTVASLCVF